MTDAIKALVKAQKEMGAVIKNANNPHFKSKYADLGAVFDACQDALQNNGFAILQPCGKDDHGAYVETVLHHESGDAYISRVYLVIGKQDMQALGSAITYARRYGLLGMAGLAPEDDDGTAAVAQAKASNTSIAELETACENIAAKDTLSALQDYFLALPSHVKAAPSVIAAKDKRKGELQSNG